MGNKKESLIIIVSAPSGSGKTTIVEGLLNVMKDMRHLISYTTREPRPGEKDGKDYLFISGEEFREKLAKGEFLEHEENFGNYYGTSAKQLVEAIDEGIDVILSIDVKGARRVKKQFPESISVFIMPPSQEELETRLKNRKTDRESQLVLRLKEAQREMAAADEYDYMIVNEDLEEAIGELREIIKTERKTRKERT